MMLLGRQTLSVSRPTGEWVDGDWVAGTPESISIEASVQPITGSDLQSLPEGRRDRTAYLLLTNTELKTVRDSAGTNPDTVEINGMTCEIIRCDPWERCSLAHYSATAVEL
jgi:hypothetical protein